MGKSKTVTRTAKETELTDGVRFINVSAELDDFMAQYAEVFEEYSTILQRYNILKESVDKELRAKCIAKEEGVDFGPWKFKHFSRRYNADTLYDLTSREDFVSLGGAVETREVRTINSDKFTLACARGEVEDDVKKRVESITPNYTFKKELP